MRLFAFHLFDRAVFVCARGILFVRCKNVIEPGKLNFKSFEVYDPRRSCKVVKQAKSVIIHKTSEINLTGGPEGVAAGLMAVFGARPAPQLGLLFYMLVINTVLAGLQFLILIKSRLGVASCCSFSCSRKKAQY